MKENDTRKFVLHVIGPGQEHHQEGILMSSKSFSTRLVHSGEDRLKPHHALISPIFHTSTYTFENTSALVDYMEAQKKGETATRLEYGRYGNPTLTVVENKLADLENGEAALLFSSGMAAVTLTLLTLVSPGAHVIITDDCYRRSRQFITKFLKGYQVEATQVSAGDYRAMEGAIRPSTRLIFTEMPTNPHLRVVDLGRIVEIGRQHSLITIVDSTIATPINLRPLEHGADLVIHSATKYLGGHNDLLAGAAVGSRDIINKLRETQALIGAICDPNTAFLLLRGLKTLEIRIQRQNETGLELARFLEGHPQVSRVYYPGLTSHSDYDTARRYMTGFGGVVSFELDADLETTSRFIDALEIPYIGPSFGGTEGLVEQVALTGYYDVPSKERWAMGISDSLVRLSAGLENTQDLIADLSQALQRAFDKDTIKTSL